MASCISPTVPYTEIVVPFALAGIGMGLFFAPIATVVMSSVRLIEAGQASGANNAIRELGGVFGVAVLASIFAHQGGYGSAALFTDGIRPALWVGSAVVAGRIRGGAGAARPQRDRGRAAVGELGGGRSLTCRAEGPASIDGRRPLRRSGDGLHVRGQAASHEQVQGERRRLVHAR